MGKVPYAEVQSYLAKAAVCVFPSFAEALPVSWIEAMAMGKAIVASDIGWAKELITNGKEGFLVSPKNHQEFAERILELLQSSELASGFGKNAKQKVINSFSISIIAKKSIQYYAKILESTKV
jgi:glycosyltransferase involved in cell wall biosynthesis